MQRITEDQGEHGSHIHGMSASMAELTRRRDLAPLFV